MLLIIVDTVVPTANAVTLDKLSAVCKSCLTFEPSALSVRSTIGIIWVDALKSTPASFISS